MARRLRAMRRMFTNVHDDMASTNLPSFALTSMICARWQQAAVRSTF